MDGTENPSLISRGGILAGLYSSTGERKTRFGRSAADLCQTCMIFRDFFAHFSHFSKEDFSVFDMKIATILDRKTLAYYTADAL